MIDQILEPLRPLKNLREMGKAMWEMQPGKVVKNYLEAVPGVYVLGRMAPVIAKYGGYAAYKLGIPAQVAAKSAAKLASTTSNLAKWFVQPAQVTAKSAASAAKSTVPKIISPVGGLIAGAVALDHGASRLLKNRVSLVDMLYAMIPGSTPTPFQSAVMNRKLSFQDFIIGDPVKTAMLKAIYKIKGGTSK